MILFLSNSAEPERQTKSSVLEGFFTYHARDPPRWNTIVWGEQLDLTEVLRC